MDAEHTTAFFEAFIHTEHRVLGKKLRPFCLWHQLLLKAANSPLISGEKVELTDMQTAVGICTTRFGQFKLNKPTFNPLNIYRIVFNLKTEHLKFRDYIEDFLCKPDYSIVEPAYHGQSAPQTRRGQAPEELIVASEVIGWSSWSERYVWELPVGAAYWYQAMARKSRGLDIDFVDDSEREFQKQMKEAQEHHANRTL